jgi:prepilin-type N-terminal cleavage/methylation domain-containing protein
MLDSRRPSRAGGFTLLEIVIVVTILAVLATVTVGYFQSVRRDAELQQCMANIVLINHAMERFKANNQFYPTNMDELLNTDAYGLPALPRCPSATSPTTPAVTYGMKVPTEGQAGYQYILYCTDQRRRPDTPAGFPQYDSVSNQFREY